VSFLCVLSWCVFTSPAFLSGAAKAGDDYADHAQRSIRVWYTSSCCYRKIVRDVTTVRYVRTKPGYRAYRTSYYRPYRDWPRWHYAQCALRQLCAAA
jgi:hypothetical protein